MHESSAVLKFNNIKICGSKLSIKLDNTFRLLFENVNGLPPDVGYCNLSWKHGRLRHVISRFQVDAAYLAETQINLALALCTFSMRDRIFKNKELVSILTNNKQEYLEIRKQGGVFTVITGLASCAATLTESDPLGLRIWNWVQLKGRTMSACVITAHKCV